MTKWSLASPGMLGSGLAMNQPVMASTVIDNALIQCQARSGAW